MKNTNIVTTSLEEALERIKRGESKTDWARVDAMTDADIAEAMRDDPDWADLIGIDWSNATIVYPRPKHAISIRLDKDIVDFFKATGKGYQTRINAVLRYYVEERLKAKKTG
jgi:uncharacterized protein (DUF4415 family)